MELLIEPLKYWQSSVDTLEESPPIDPSTIKLDPSYKEWLALYPNGAPIEMT
jgi:hypothetical protein